MKLAIFDFDGTLFPKDTLPFLFKQWHNQNYSKLRLLRVYLPLIPLYITYKLGFKSKLSREEMKLIAFQKFHRIFKGMSEREVIDYLADSSDAIIELLNSAIISEVKKAQELGFHTVILSGSYTLLLKQIADHLKIDTVIGTEIQFKDGIIDLATELDVASGQSKVEKLFRVFKDEKVDWLECYAYADSYSDIHLLKSVGHPVVVNPDSKLESIATQTDWEIITS